MAKIETKRGKTRFRYVKELGGAAARTSASKTARVLLEKGLVRGRALDYGCGRGYDADHHGWDAYDPYYRQTQPRGTYDTVVCNHVANILTRRSRQALFASLDSLLSDGGIAYVSVARNIPRTGKFGTRRRLQNYVVLSLPSVYADDEEEIYALEKGAAFRDSTRDIEDALA